MRLLVVFLLLALIVLPTEGWLIRLRRRRRRFFRRRIIRIRLIGKRDALSDDDVNANRYIDKSEAEMLKMDKRALDAVLNRADKRDEQPLTGEDPASSS